MLSGFRVWDALWSGVQGCRAACDCVLPQLRQQVQVCNPPALGGEHSVVGRHMTRLEQAQICGRAALPCISLQHAGAAMRGWVSGSFWAAVSLLP